MRGEIQKKEGVAKRRKKFRRLHRKITGRKIGYAYNPDILGKYFAVPGRSAHPVCGYIRSPRVNLPYDHIPTKIYGLCHCSPDGMFKSDGLGVCDSAFPMVKAKKCEHMQKFLLEDRFNEINEIRGVQFRSGNEEHGMSGYVQWGNRYLVVNVDLEKKSAMEMEMLREMSRFGYDERKRNSIYRITVLGILDRLCFDENGRMVEKTVAVPKRKRNNVRKLLFGLENQFLRELKNWSFVEEDERSAYPDKSSFKDRIKIPA